MVAEGFYLSLKESLQMLLEWFYVDNMSLLGNGLDYRW